MRVLSTSHPFLFQDGILDGVLVDRVPVGVIDERDETPEESLATHAESFAEMLTACIVVVHIGVNAAHALPREKIVEEGIRRLVRIAAATMRGVQDQARREGVRGRRGASSANAASAACSPTARRRSHR